MTRRRVVIEEPIRIRAARHPGKRSGNGVVSGLVCLMGIPLLHLGTKGPLLHFAPANGFPPATYRPLLDLLLPEYQIMMVPPRALWPDAGAPPDGPGSWRELADDVLKGLAEHGVDQVVAVGHSFGAVVSMLAVLQDPSRFRGLVLLDPTILPPSVMDAVRTARTRGEEVRFPLVEGALRRRNWFGSEPEAYLYFREKELFADWPDTALGYYAAGVLRQAPDAQDVALQLAWPPEWEAYYYRSFYPDSWSDLPRLDGLLPTLVLGGETSATFDGDSALLVRRILPRATHVTVKGYGHLFPLAAPEETAHVLRGWLSDLSLSPGIASA